MPLFVAGTTDQESQQLRLEWPSPMLRLPLQRAEGGSSPSASTIPVCVRGPSARMSSLSKSGQRGRRPGSEASAMPSHIAVVSNRSGRR